MTGSGRATLIFVAGAGALLFGAGQVNAQSAESTGQASNTSTHTISVTGSGNVYVENDTSSKSSAGGVTITTDTKTSFSNDVNPDETPQSPGDNDQGLQENNAVPRSSVNETQRVNHQPVIPNDQYTKPAKAQTSAPLVTKKALKAYQPAFTAPSVNLQPVEVTSSAPTEPPVSSDGLDRYTSWLNQILVPAAFYGFLTAAKSLPGEGTAVLLTVAAVFLASALGGYISQLRRSGYTHGARSDADGVFNPVTPAKVGLVWAFSPVQSSPFSGGLTKLKKGGE
jgi:hypothetical protein